MKKNKNSNLDNFWMPFTANRIFKQNPRLLVKAEGMFYTSEDGRKILDGISGMWCCNAGHCHPHIVKAVQDQIAEMDYATAFNMAHPSVFKLANKISQLTPDSLNKIFFANSGSEAVDTALKIALAYHASNGEADRTKFISREKGYHGVNFGGTSVGGILNNRINFGPLFEKGNCLSSTWNLEEMAFSKGQPDWGDHLATELEEILLSNGPSNVAAVILEPIVGSGGVIVPPKGYLELIKEICTKYNVLLIFDEVITGFGRVGEAFASKRFGICPDIITMAKGLTNASVPMSAVAVDNSIYNQIVNNSKENIELFHGYTYSGHPVAAAAAIASLEVYEKEDLFNKSKEIEDKFEEAVHSLKGENTIVDIRNFGLMAAIHFSSDITSATDKANSIFQYCYENDVLVRFSGDYIVLSPALIAKEEHIDKIVHTIREGLRNL